MPSVFVLLDRFSLSCHYPILSEWEAISGQPHACHVFPASSPGIIWLFVYRDLFKQHQQLHETIVLYAFMLTYRVLSMFITTTVNQTLVFRVSTLHTRWNAG